MGTKKVIVGGAVACIVIAAVAFPFLREELISYTGNGVRPPNLAQAQEPAKAAKKVPVGKNIFLEVEEPKRRVLVNAQVCLRKGHLEQLLTLKQTKEHEAILVADIDARQLQQALLLANAKSGNPVAFEPKFMPPTGDPIKVTLEYQENGKTVRRPAQEWLRNVQTKKPLDVDWVFAGSRLFNDPLNPNAPPTFAANGGDVICVVNFDSALLALPFDSSKDNDSLAYETNTDLIPPLETPVTVILELAPAKK